MLAICRLQRQTMAAIHTGDHHLNLFCSCWNEPITSLLGWFFSEYDMQPSAWANNSYLVHPIPLLYMLHILVVKVLYCIISIKLLFSERLPCSLLSSIELQVRCCHQSERRLNPVHRAPKSGFGEEQVEQGRSLCGLMDPGETSTRFELSKRGPEIDLLKTGWSWDIKKELI